MMKLHSFIHSAKIYSAFSIGYRVKKTEKVTFSSWKGKRKQQNKLINKIILDSDKSFKKIKQGHMTA